MNSASCAGVELTLADGQIVGMGNFFASDPGWPAQPILWDRDQADRIYVCMGDGRWWSGVGFSRSGRWERKVEPIDGVPPASAER